MTQSGHIPTGQNRREWPLGASSSANVDRSQFDDEIAMTSSRANEILDKGAMTDDERAIRDLVATWMKASETGDDASLPNGSRPGTIQIAHGKPRLRLTQN